MLQKGLNEGNVVSVAVVDIRCVPFAEGMGADFLITEEITHSLEVLLNGTNCDREHGRISGDPLLSAIIAEVTVDFSGNCEGALLPGFLFGDVQAVTVAISDDVGQLQPENVTDTHTEVCFGNQRRSNAGIGTECAAPRLDGVDDGFIFLGR